MRKKKEYHLQQHTRWPRPAEAAVVYQRSRINRTTPTALPREYKELVPSGKPDHYGEFSGVACEANVMFPSARNVWCKSLAGIDAALTLTT